MASLLDKLRRHRRLAALARAQKRLAKGDKPGGLKRVRALAEKGLPEAQVALAHLYEKGEGVVPSIAEAFRWYQSAAEQGSPEGQAKLGEAYLAGLMKRDGHGSASDGLLDELFEKGFSVPKNIGEAVRWTRLAAQGGHVAAAARLGILHASGSGVDQDFAAAEHWLTLAAEKGAASRPG